MYYFVDRSVRDFLFFKARERCIYDFMRAGARLG